MIWEKYRELQIIYLGDNTFALVMSVNVVSTYIFSENVLIHYAKYGA